MHVDGHLRARLEGDVDQAAVVGERADVALDVVAADDVEDDVDAAAFGLRLDDLDEVLGLVVDGARRPELDGRPRTSPASRQWRSPWHR